VHPRKPQTITRTMSVISLASLVAVISACGSSAAAQQSSSGGKPGSSSVVLNVGDQQQDLETLFASSDALSGTPYKVNFVEFDSGPLVDAGFAAHRIDVGSMGDLPASLAAKSHLPVVAAAVGRPIGSYMYLLAKPGITSIAQLRGKNVAYTTGTAEQAFALRALRQAGLTQKDVHQVNVSLLQLGTVLQGGAADASVVSAEQKVNYQQAHPGAKVLATIDSVQPPSYSYVLAATSALANRGKQDAVEDFIRRLIKAQNWEKAHKSQWVTDYYVNVEHQTPQVAQLILAAGGTITYAPINAAVKSALQQMVNLMASSGAFPAAYTVSGLYSAPQSARYDAILKEIPQNG
jgi:sulfonate transport system substrate-binding protein